MLGACCPWPSPRSSAPGRLPACQVAADGSSGRPARVLHPVSRSTRAGLGRCRTAAPHGLPAHLYIDVHAATVYPPCLALLTHSLAPLTCVPFAPCMPFAAYLSHAGVPPWAPCRVPPRRPPCCCDWPMTSASGCADPCRGLQRAHLLGQGQGAGGGGVCSMVVPAPRVALLSLRCARRRVRGAERLERHRRASAARAQRAARLDDHRADHAAALGAVRHLGARDRLRRRARARHLLGPARVGRVLCGGTVVEASVVKQRPRRRAHGGRTTLRVGGLALFCFGVFEFFSSSQREEL